MLARRKQSTVSAFCMIKKVLIANRGEIAIRAVRAARELGIRTVAVYSQADEESLHTRMADQAIALGGNTARETYLDSRKLIAAAIQTGCDAVYPGYGFLAENSAFAAAVIKAGLIFIGPPPAVIKLMGDKDLARQTAAKNGVPVVPGTSVEDGEDGIRRLIEQNGYPIVIKAVAGGSGRGMRIVHNPQELKAKIGEARREAEGAFNDGRLIAEKYLEHPRHIEVQIFGDSSGKVLHFGERDCSTQRRNQKLVEESPAPNLDPGLRRSILEAAVKLGRAVGYIGAGTVECLVPSTGDAFYFLEMNTRIQVEHAVTEAVCGVDLVALQFKIASGLKLELEQEEVRFSGHAIQFRIYAENSDHGFSPALGRIEYMLRPGGIGVREDSWAEAGTVISPFYDSLISKIVVSGGTRQEAIIRSRRVLDECIIDGVPTTLPFHRALVVHPDFIGGRIDVSWISRVYAPAAMRLNPGKAVGPLEVPLKKTSAAKRPAPGKLPRKKAPKKAPRKAAARKGKNSSKGKQQ